MSLGWMSGFALACLCACAGKETPHAPAGAPNVLFITIDTLRGDRLGFAGYPRPTSPALDAFAQGAVVFEDAQASAPWTLPALSSLMTGEVAATHGCTTFGSVLDDSFVTLTERLLAGGYDTACVVSHLFATSRHGLQQGFVHTDDSYAYPEVDPAQNISSQVISDQAIRFLDQKGAAREGAEGGATPWMLWLHYFDPHEDYMEHPGISAGFVTPGERGPAQVFGDLYDGEVRYTDLHVGRVLQRLTELGYDANTVVVLVADHGEEFGEHGATGHGHSMHREVVHVPLVIRAPGCAPRRVSTTVRQIDVLPTVLELVGLPSAAGLPGRSLVPALLGQPLREEGALSELANGAYLLDSWQKGGFKLIRSVAAGTTELYELAGDAQELHDVSATHAGEVATLQAELDAAKLAGQERARLYGGARELAYTPAQQDDLEKLGYGGDKSGDGAEGR